MKLLRNKILFLEAEIKVLDQIIEFQQSILAKYDAMLARQKTFISYILSKQ